MTIFGLLLFLLIAGIALWMFPIEATIRNIIIGLIVIIAAVWLFAAMGLIPLPAGMR